MRAAHSVDWGMDSQNLRLGRFAMPCLLAMASAAALGQEPNPYYVGASQALSRESNLFRVADGLAASSDTVSTTSLLAGLDQPIGRQRLFADLALRAARYSDNSHLNHTGTSLLTGLDWSAADAFSGRLSFGTDRVLARYGADLGFEDQATRVLQTTEELILRGQYGLVALLSIEAGFARRKLDFSVESGNSFEQDAVSVGLKYRPSGALVLGIGLRRTEGTYPFAGPAGAAVRGDDFDRDDVDLLAVWVPTAASTLTARLSRTSEKHQGLAVRNVKGTTGALSWILKPTGKLAFTADWVRDTGAETTFSGGVAVPGAAAISSPLATTRQLQAEYEATAKIQVQALMRYLKRDLIDAAGVAASGEDSLTEMRLGVNWTPLRSVLVGCSIGREERNTSSSLSSGYSATTTRCLARFKTQ